MSNNIDEQATSANTVTIMVGSYLNMDQMIPSGVVPSLVANGDIGLDALDYDMAYVTYNGSYENDLVTQLAGAWGGSGSGTQEMTEYSGISAGTLELTNTTGAAIDVAAQGALFTATDGRAYETEEAPTNAAWSNGTSQTGSGYDVVAPGQTITVAVEATFQGDDPGSDAAGSITGSSIAGLSVIQPDALSPGSSYTNPADNTQTGWLTSNFGNYTFVFTDQGLSPAEGHVNVNGAISWTPTDVASWDGYVAHARSVGILNVAPLESGTVPEEDPTQPFATSAFYAGFRAAALYGGGFEIELPSYYWGALAPSEQQTVIEEIRWCNENGIRSSLLVNNQTDFAGDPDPSFAADTVKMLGQLEAEDALPSQVVLENDNSTNIGSYYDASTSDVNSLNAVALDLAADFNFKPTASEDGLEVKGTSTAQTTLIMTGVEETENVVAGRFAPYTQTLVASEDPTKVLTLKVTDTKGLLALADSVDGTRAGAGGTLTFSGTAAQATTFVDDLTAAAASGTVGVAQLTLTLTDDLGQTIEGVTSVYLGQVHPTFTAVTETTNAAGALYTGATVTFTVATSAKVTVTGSPTLVLTNEQSATYAGQDSKGDLLFAYTVKAGDDTAALRVRGLRLDGATITDSRNALSIDPDSIDAPEEAMANPLAIDTKNDTIIGVSEATAASGALKAGAQVTFLLAANKPVAAVSGMPTLSLNNGGIATYAGLTGSGQMEFKAAIPAGGVDTALAPTALNMNGATIRNDLGVTVDAPATLPAPAATLSYDTITDTIVAVTETASVSGKLAAGDNVTFRLSAAKPISTVNGAPTLSLNNGGTATYAGLTSAGQMEFTTTIPRGGADGALAPKSLNLNGAAVTDDAGRAVDAPATLPAPATELSYDTIADTIVTVTESASASGALAAGDRITFLLGASKPISTVSGAPTLSLKNGATATYAGLTSTGEMEFTTTVPRQGIDPGVAPTSLNMNGATVTDDAGATVSPSTALPRPATELSYNTTTDAIATVTETASASGTLSAGDSITFFLGAAKLISTVDGKPTLSLNDGGTATYAGLTSAGQLEFTYAIPSSGTFTDVAPTSLNMAAAVVADDAGATVTAPSTLPTPATLLSYGPAVAPPTTSTTITSTTISSTTTKSGSSGSTASATDTSSSPATIVSLVDGVPVTIPSGQQIGAPVPLSGQAASFTDGSSVGIVDPSGNAETLAHLYQAVLGRAPDVAGLEGWIGQVDGGSIPIATAAADFVSSSEFASKFGSLSNAAFVNVLAENTTGSAAAAADQDYVSALDAGTSRGTVAMQFAESASNVVNMLGTSGDTDYGEVYRIYKTTLARAPDATGLPGYLAQLQAGTPLQNIVQDFTNSREFMNDFGATSNTQFITAMYRNGLGRAPDSLGLQSWVNDLNNGASRASVVLAISDSLESRMDTATATHDNWVRVPR